MALRRDAAEQLYAVAVEDAVGCWLALWVKRSRKGDYFVFLPRNEGQWNPHASWHANGRFHHKTYDYRMAFQQRQRPDASFQGSENMILTPLSADVPTLGAECIREEFDGALVVSVSRLAARQHLVSVDLAEAGHCEVVQPGSRLVEQHVFNTVIPSVVVTLWEPVYALVCQQEMRP